MQAPTEILIAECIASPTARPIKVAHVIVLAESIRQTGLRQPINVRKVPNGYEIRGGGHRVEAFRRLGRDTIPAFICDDDDLHAELAEIDENLIRNELSPAERAIAISRRKAIYEQLHPETVHGSAPKPKRKSRQIGDSPTEKDKKTERFSKSTAAATGASERAIQRDAARGEALGAETLSKVAGTSLDTGEQIDALAKLSEPKRAELVEKAAAGQDVNAKAAVKAEKRQTKERSLADKTRALPQQQFSVIYADVPSHFETWSEDGMDRSAENHYPTMSIEELLDMDVPSIAADDCVLFFWTTVPQLIEHLYIVEAWGFLQFRPRGPDGKLARGEDGKLVPFNPDSRYVSHCIWGKDRIGTGYWFRNKHELLLVFVKGEIPAPLPGTQMESLLNAAVRDHSRKPIIFRGMIEGFFPNLPKIELFARTPAPGWHQWGKEAPEQPKPAHDDDDITSDKREASLMTAHAHDDNDGAIQAPEGGYPVADDMLDVPQFLRRPSP